ncbi:hypothetical protein BSK20_01905 [SR1 bacterium human oral taxon HOT-345]|nr:hypothetical protein BSK20_01905 [SR1 bacterium human oral taxon HOT-345]
MVMVKVGNKNACIIKKEDGFSRSDFLFLPIFGGWRMWFVGRFFAGIEYLKKSTGFLISGGFDGYER